MYRESYIFVMAGKAENNEVPEEIDEEGLTQFVHKRRFKKGARPGLTCKAITGGPALRQQDRAVRFSTCLRGM